MKREYCKSDKEGSIAIKIFCLVASIAGLSAVVGLVSVAVSGGRIITWDEALLWCSLISASSFIVGIFFQRMVKSYDMMTFISRLDNSYTLYGAMFHCIRVAKLKGWDDDIDNFNNLLKNKIDKQDKV